MDTGHGDRVTAALTPDTVKALEALQERSDVKKVDLVNRALVVLNFVDAETRAGSTFTVEKTDGAHERLVFFF